MKEDRPLTVQGDYLATLGNCGGFYEGLVGDPLVAYAGDYSAPDGTRKHFVGRVYANFAKAEEWSHVLKFCAQNLGLEMRELLDTVDVVCGAPLGGYGLAYALGLTCGIAKVIKAEKKVTVAGTKTVKEESVVVLKRHEIKPGSRVVIAEDVTNNFKTTAMLIKLIEDAGGIVVAIVCFLNRSLAIDKSFHYEARNIDIPVISLVRKPIAEYKQEDPEVAADIAAGNVVWDPKKTDQWERLMTAMAVHNPEYGAGA